MADEDVRHLSNLYQLDTVQARLDYSTRCIPQEPASLSRIGSSFHDRFQENGKQVDVETAIAFEQRVVDLTPEGHADKPGWLDNLGMSFLCRFMRLGDLVDINSAVRVQREAVDLTPEGHANKAMYLDNFGISLMRRFERLGDVADIDSAICVQSQAVDLVPEGHADKPIYLDNFGISFQCRFRRLGDVTDVESAIRVQRQAVDLIPDDHADQAMYLNNFGNSLQCRFGRLGEVADIDSAIRVQRQAVDLTPDDHADKHMYLNNLGLSLMRRFERLGDVTDIDSAVLVQRQAVDLTPDDHTDKPKYLDNFGNSFQCRFGRLGDVADVDSAIRVQRQAVDLIPDDYADKAMHLNNLGLSLMRRFRRLDIDSAIRVQRQAVSLTTEGHANKHMYLNNLGLSLMRRSERLGDVADIDSAIHVQHQAVDLTPEGHAAKPAWLNNLGNSFRCRFQRLGNIADVDSAIGVQRQAVDLIHEGHTGKPIYLNSLGNSFQCRFEQLGDVADINSAIHVQCQAVDLTPEGHTGRPMYLNNLGNSFQCRSERLGDTVDFHAAVDVYRTSANSSSGPPLYTFDAAHKWAKLLSSPHSTLSSPLEAYRVVLALVPRVVWLGSNLHRRYEELPAIAEVVSEAVAAAISAGDLACALEWLEEGRCVIWGQMLQLRTPLDDLRAVDPVLADCLERASRALDVAGTSQGLQSSEKEVETSMEDEAQKHRRLADEYERMVEKARALPGCEDFLRPKRLAHFRAAADLGPVVVINIAEKRCDALILLQTSYTVLHVPLPALNRAKVDAWKDSMLQYLRGSWVRARGSRRKPRAAGDKNSVLSVLANLWSNIVQPIVSALAESSGDLWAPGDIPHLTWCATGPLAFLPIHAAGIYGDEAGPKVFEFVVSSYTPTLSALLEAGRRANSHSSTPSVLAVSQLGTGPHSLLGTVKEIKAVQKIVGNHGLYLAGDEATKDSVLTAMADHSWIHLACHAHQDIQDPTQSAFILHDSQLELLSIMQRSFKHTELAFLSTCQTATGDEKLTEEAVHLAAGMLMAGYSSVVATMWSIMDRDAPVIAEAFYSRLMEDGGDGRRKVAYALHDAVKLLRDKVGEREFVRWIPFIHLGV